MSAISELLCIADSLAVMAEHGDGLSPTETASLAAALSDIAGRFAAVRLVMGEAEQRSEP
jgi:hypothetical protein